MGVVGPDCLILWLLTSVGDNKDDILVKGLRAGQSHLSAKLFHYVQGHLWMGEVRGWASQVTSALSPPWHHCRGKAPRALGQPHTGRTQLLELWVPSLPISHLQPDYELKATHLP